MFLYVVYQDKRHYHKTEYPWGSKTLKETPKTVKKINIGG